jgi:hypothetical protein
LVEDYPDHDFVVDATEADGIGLRIDKPSPEVGPILDALATQIDGWTLIGRVEAVQGGDKPKGWRLLAPS